MFFIVAAAAATAAVTAAATAAAAAAVVFFFLRRHNFFFFYIISHTVTSHLSIFSLITVFTATQANYIECKKNQRKNNTECALLSIRPFFFFSFFSFSFPLTQYLIVFSIYVRHISCSFPAHLLRVPNNFNTEFQLAFAILKQND